MQTLTVEDHSSIIEEFSKIRELNNYYEKTTTALESERQNIRANIHENNRIAHALHNIENNVRPLKASEVKLIQKVLDENDVAVKKMREIEKLFSAIDAICSDKITQLYQKRSKAHFVIAGISLVLYVAVLTFLNITDVIPWKESFAASSNFVPFIMLFLMISGVIISFKNPKHWTRSRL